MPQTFQDAIRYCIELDIAYLWIDALCILQDDNADWQIESARMADIYQNSFITLAATSASCGAEGCFPTNTMARVREAVVSLPNTLDKLTANILVRPKFSHWGDITSAAASKAHSPLLSRGWVFQERILSPRVLHFSKGELIWECGATTSCECGGFRARGRLKGEFGRLLHLDPGISTAPATSPTESSGITQLKLGKAQLCWTRCPEMPVKQIRTLLWRSRIINFNLMAASDAVCEAQGAEQDESHTGTCAIRTVSGAQRHLHIAQTNYLRLADYRRRIPKSKTEVSMELWHEMATQFSSLQLTKPSDRLPALSGLAERMQLILGEYIAGLWSQSLVYDMAWRVQNLPSGLRRPEKYRGPSWSWVSVDATVSFWTREEISPTSYFSRLGDELPKEFFRADNHLETAVDDEPEDRPVDDDHESGSLEDRPLPGLAESYPFTLNMCGLDEHSLKLIRKPVLFSPVLCTVNKSGRNPYGEVSSALLKVDGFTRDATLLIESSITSPTKMKTEHHSYSLELEFSPDDIRIPPAVSSLRLPFFADYDLAREGIHQVTMNSRLLVLLLFEDISLVIIPTLTTREGVRLYRRIGLFVLPEEYTRGYGLTLRQGSRPETISLI